MRRLPLRFGPMLAGITFLGLVLAVTIAIAEDDVQPKSVAGIKNVMNALNSEKTGLFGLIKDFSDKGGSEDGEVWKLMRDRAQVLGEVGNILMPLSAPRGADDEAGVPRWKKHCVTYRDLCKDLSKALAFKKTDMLKSAVDACMAQCEACHKDHKSN